MGRAVTVNVPHGLGKEEARRRIGEGFAEMQPGGPMALLSMKQYWEGDRLHFEGSGLGQTIRGRLDVLAESVQIQIDLPLMLAAIADLITGPIKKRTQKLLGQQ
jgi:putative polyhydroxyalkanoate system protein